MSQLLFADDTAPVTESGNWLFSSLWSVCVYIYILSWLINVYPMRFNLKMMKKEREGERKKQKEIDKKKGDERD